eukprot:jgi/Mesvir1/17396/Mv26319-RA.1
MKTGIHVRRLDEKISSLIKSEATVRGLDQALEELVCNSIDAKATRVTITTDESAVSVEVYDDGHGIRSEDLPLIGTRHVTSKLKSLQDLERGVTTLGFRGEALNSLAHIAVVEILTKRSDDSGTFRKILQGGNSLACGLSIKHRERGTTVLVRDLFYQQPVRRQILINGWTKEVARARERVVWLALAHPNIAFTLKEVDSHRRGRVTSETHGGRNQLSDVIAELWGSPSSLPLLFPFSASDPVANLKVAGFLSAPTQPSKVAQYLFVNRRLVKKTPVHKLLSSASVCTSQDDQGADGAAARDARRHPAFFIHITCDPSLYDILYDADKSTIEFKRWEPVLECIKTRLPALVREQSRCPRLEQDVSCSAFKTHAKPSVSHNMRGETMIDDFFPCKRKAATLPHGAKCMRSSNAALDTCRAVPTAPSKAQGSSWGSMALSALPPSTSKAAVPTVAGAAAAFGVEVDPGVRPSRAVQPCVKERTGEPSMLSGLAPADFARVFGAPEPEILDLASDTLWEPLTGACQLVPGAVTKRDMNHVRVITQLDNKFILLLAGGGAKLAMVDQHAADERILLENLRKQVFDPNQAAREALLQSCSLKSPFVFQLSPLEVQLLCEYKAAVEAWGWRFRCDDIHRPEEDAIMTGIRGVRRVTLLAAPTLLGTPLTVDDLQAFLALMHRSHSSTVAPPGVLSILSSKACRAAIKFGDALTAAESLNLMQQLQETRLCFQCAHGRPTMVPLVDMAELHRAFASSRPPHWGHSPCELGALHDSTSAHQLSGSSLARMKELCSTRHKATLARAIARLSSAS